MKKSLMMVCLMLFLLSAAAGAQDVCVRDTVFPDAGNCGYDAEDYQLDMAWDIDGDSWAVKEVLTFTSEWDTDELRFDFTDALAITELAVNGDPVEFEREKTKLAVHYPFTHDTRYTLSAEFSGKLQWGELFDPEGEGRNPKDGFCMLNEPTNAWRFYICNDHPKDKATYHYSFTVPANYVPAGSGRLLKIEEASETVILPGKSWERSWNPDAGEGTVTFTYAQETQTAPYLFTVCAGAFDMKLQTLDDGKVQLDFVDRNHPYYDKAWELSGIEAEIIDALSEFFGDYPYEGLGAIVAVTDMGAALETQGRSLYDAGTTEDFIFAHETTHQWMGDLISLEDWSDLWIKEGAASFGEALWIEHKGGRKAYEDYMRKFYEPLAIGRYNETEASVYLDAFGSQLEDQDKVYDHESMVKAASSLCQIPADQIQLKEGSLTYAEWAEDVSANCEMLTVGPLTLVDLYEMVGLDTAQLALPADGPKEVKGNDPDVLYGKPAYNGGAVLYHALRCRLGDDLFKQALQTLIAENKWGTVNEEKFIDVFSRVSGEDLTGFIRPYLYYSELGHIPDLIGIETWEEAMRKYDVGSVLI